VVLSCVVWCVNAIEMENGAPWLHHHKCGVATLALEQVAEKSTK